MSRDIFTTWHDYQQAAWQVIGLAASHLEIYDQDLAWLKLDAPAQISQIERLLRSPGSGIRFTLIVRDASLLLSQHPRLLQLMETYSHVCAVQQSGPTLAHLRDTLLIADRRHAVIRFETNLPRCKLLIDEPSEIRGYGERFDEIRMLSDEAIRRSTLGL